MHSLRHHLIPMLSLCGLCACSSQYNIDGNSSIAGIDGQKMYLRMSLQDGKTEMLCLDSCEVVHGTFRFDGAIDSVAMVDLYMGSAPMMPVVLENGSLFIQMDNAAQSVSGGPMNDRLNEFLTKRNRVENELWDLNRRARMMVYEGKSLEQIVAVIDPIKEKLVEQMNTLEVNFVKQNYDNVLGPGYFMRMCNNNMGMTTANDDVMDILQNAPESFLRHPFVEHFMFITGLSPSDFPGTGKGQTRRLASQKKTQSDSTDTARRKVKNPKAEKK